MLFTDYSYIYIYIYFLPIILVNTDYQLRAHILGS